MNNVDRPGGGLGRGAEYLTQNSFGRDVGDKRGLEADLLDRDSLEFDDESTESSSTATGREAEFLRSFRAAARQKNGENGQDQDTNKEQTPDLRTLAVAEQQLWTGLPSPANVVSNTNENSSSIGDKIASIAEVIDRSIRAEMAPKAGEPLSVRIAFNDESLGLAGLQITVTQTTLDVVFERIDSVLSDEAVRAAQLLAERLMTRFSKKIVRILDTVVADENADQQQLQATITAPFKPFL